MARLRGLPSRVRSQRRKTAWGIGTQTGTDGSSQSISAAGKTIATGAFQPVQDGLTVVRTRGELLLLLRSTSGGNTGFHGAFGIGLITDEAAAAGAASVPGPIANEDWDGWLYHRYFSLATAAAMGDTVSSADDIPNAVSAVLRLEVDSKAMRKFDTGNTMVAMLEVLEVGTSVLDWFFNSRTLVKLA